MVNTAQVTTVDFQGHLNDVSTRDRGKNKTTLYIYNSNQVFFAEQTLVCTDVSLRLSLRGKYELTTMLDEEKFVVHARKK